MDATCKTCPMWTRLPPREGEDKSKRGSCHHVHAAMGDDTGTRYEDWFCSEHPLRQRDRLAAMALVGLLSDPTSGLVEAAEFAEAAYQMADAMLAASLSPPSEGAPS